MISNQHKKLFVAGASMIGVISALSFLAIVLLAGQRWLNQQQSQTAKLWQYAQALQIAENQAALQLLEQPCQRQVIQNQVTFIVHCEAQQIIVKYPLGELKI